mmetsp:Transcript_21166/g.45723  ORF Transcript_21166/g.45723 Transcript_21166/m.45723 type:complete len:355 (-) Transcript_21166:566-1630(-)
MPSRCCIVSVSFTAIMIAILAALLWIFLADKDEPNALATCGDCHCIVSTGLGAASGLGDSSCPTRKPKIGSDYTPATIEALKRQRPLNPFNLTCDPYDDENCELDPPQDDSLDILNSAVCGLVYQFPFNGAGGTLSGEIFEAGTYKNANTDVEETLCPDAPTEYLMISYENKEAAEADGAVITHVGPCGACSTTQDLAVYLTEPDLLLASKECVKRSILNQDEGKTCFQDLGFTDACAAIWLANGENTGQRCALPCAAAEIQDYNNNGPAPECALNGCLECDEKYSGPKFKRYAGRTRRRSGILSTIARPCEDVVFIDHDYACPSEAGAESSGEVAEEESEVATAAATSFFESP